MSIFRRRRRLPLVEVVRLQPGDRLLVRGGRYMTPEAADRLCQQVAAAFGREFPVMILHGDVDLTVVREGETPR